MPDRKSNTESVLLKGLKKNSHECFQHLFEQYSKPLYRFSMSYLKSNEAAEDVVQEVFFKIWKKRHEIDGCKSFQSYLFTIALNTIRKQFNKMADFNQMKHDLLVSFSENREKLDQTEDYRELINKLEFFIGQMPERRREIFRKKKMEGKSLKEISEEYQITPKTVEYHITEAMKFLRKEFERLRIGGMVFFFLFVKNP